MRMLRLSAVALVLLLAFSFTAPASTEPPALASLFGQERTSGQDLVLLKNGEVLAGEVLNTGFTLCTVYGSVDTPKAALAGLSFVGASPATAITRNFNRVTGILSDRLIRFKAKDDGAEVELPACGVKSILFRITKDETAPAESDLLVMANGDILTGRTGDPNADMCALALDFGTTVESVNKNSISKLQAGQGGQAASMLASYPELTGGKYWGLSLTGQGDPWSQAPHDIELVIGAVDAPRMGPVGFSHRAHNTDYGVSCAECHHWQGPNPDFKCAACHQPDKKVGKVVNLKNAFHIDCKGCHKNQALEGKAKAPYKKCAGCHKAK